MSIETMTKLATYTVGAGGISSYTFSNIPQNYTDLVIVGSVRTNRSGTDEDGMAMIINGLTTGYTYRGFIGNGASASSINTAFEQPWFTRVPGNTATGGVFGSFRVTIPRYSEYTQKSYSVDGVQENNTTTGYLNLLAITNTTTLPVTSLEFRSATGATMQQHSTITLYGIKNARTSIGNAIKASGGQISFDGTYVSHTFNSSGTFIPFDSLFVDYLVVGGGGAGERGGSGGGAGGYRTASNFSVISGTPYSISVGSGGTGGTGYNATAGSNSVFSTIISNGGGQGAGFTASPSYSGASGGGAGGQNNLVVAGGTATPSGQGNIGGSSNASSTTGQRHGGGGGGAGQAGANGTTSGGGKGGDGLSSLINGFLTFYAGGGGAGADRSLSATAGAGGIGGGGAGGSGSSASINGNSGSLNTGGGGGGGNASTSGTEGNGGNGGSGVVIIRYKP
jgi:hypothetical protein